MKPGRLGSPARPSVRVFAVDDHAAFLRTVALVVDATEGFELVGTAGSGPEALAALTGQAAPDLLLVDVAMPGMTGLELARHYHSDHRDDPEGARVILMSSYDARDLPNETLTDGAVAGFLPKSFLAPDTLRRIWVADATGT